MSKKVILMILDGWGLANVKESSAICKANTSFIDNLYKEYPFSKIGTSGMQVGLPDGQMGNSEVGHMNLGAGRVVYQDLVKINLAVENKTIDQEAVLVEAFEYAKANGKKVHFAGLLSSGGVHSHIDHLKGLLDATKTAGLKDVFVHAFMDGRDVDPKSGKGFVAEIEKFMETSNGKLASLVGRFYAMDRDNRWERVKEAYDVMINAKGEKFASGSEAVAASYANDLTDEFIKPSVMVDENNNPVGKIEEGDVVFMFNYRTDRGREMVQVLTQKDFPEFGMEKKDLHLITMTNYDGSFKGVNVLYDKENVKETLGEIVSKLGKKQIRIAETEKYAHVTFFFNGGQEEPFEGEERILVSSPKVATYDLQPEMSAAEVTDKLLPELDKQEAELVVLNYANTDMVGHTGIFSAAITAVEAVDKSVERTIASAKKNGYTVLITADHGNADFMINSDGSPNTAHTTNPVPFIVVDDEYKGGVKDGVLADIAPTILELMGIEKPASMDNESLLTK
ncbi:MAG: 2,3-bisphosphoglycerate-independent phosphoglycerate mutase [Ichthyobacteriaceae bacterium]|nr:2,3-bisphosphoglycerate-independent phosphoglycerate mutase [Ichthyobacteriaceae bacterium]